MKLDLILDCNSFSHISLVEINREKPSSWLWKYFNVMTTNSVRNEFGNGVHNANQNSKAINRKLKSNEFILIPKHFKNIESTWLAKNYYNKTLSSGDLGERELICTTLEFSLRRKFLRGILVTDDSTALNSFLNKIKEETNFGEIWNSLDLLLYLYLIRYDVLYGDILNGIRDIISMPSISAKKYRNFGNTDDLARQTMLSEYISRLNKIKELKQLIPKP